MRIVLLFENKTGVTRKERKENKSRHGGMGAL
jgi:hypothetical protein